MSILSTKPKQKQKQRIEENSLNDSDGTSSNGNGGEKDIMDLLVPMKIGDYKHLVKFYGALHAEV